MKNSAETIRMHEAFWRGKGRSLPLTPTARMEQYDVVGYRGECRGTCDLWHELTT